MKKFCILILLLATFAGCQPVRQTTAGELSNKNTGWGFRRTEAGPEFTQEQKNIMKEYGCIYRENTNEKNLYLTQYGYTYYKQNGCEIYSHPHDISIYLGIKR